MNESEPIPSSGPNPIICPPVPDHPAESEGAAMTERRITASEVRDAYQRTGLKPAVLCWFKEVDSSACGLGAVLVDRCGVDAARKVEAEPDGDDVECDVAMQLGLSTLYVAGFVNGFDAENEPAMLLLLDDDEWKDVNREYVIGYLDGQASHQAVFGHEEVGPGR